MEQLIDMPIYKKIALDLAGRICSGEIKEGTRLYGRSTLASEYNVSPETIRRAVYLLEDMKVVMSSQGSGIFIESMNNAYAFIEKFQNKESIRSLKNKMKDLILQKRAIENDITEMIDKIIDYSDRLKNVNALTPLEIEIEDDSHLIGRTITDTKFWQNTGATIIAIKRNGSLILSPGPYGGFEKGDTIFVVGDSNILTRIKSFMAEA
jgi:K+/H+ antiporter YhaU regulatory subunit KhtT